MLGFLSIQNKIVSSMNPVLKTRAKLSVEQVIEIFSIKDTLPASSAADIARRFGVSDKTVRDIWSGRTWCGETWHLDTTRVVEPRNIGRPTRDTRAPPLGGGRPRML